MEDVLFPSCVDCFAAAATRKIVSVVWQQLGFFRDAPFYHVHDNVDAPIVERRRQGGKDGSCGFELGIRESCGLVICYRLVLVC
jgi:hypothetical protein